MNNPVSATLSQTPESGGRSAVATLAAQWPLWLAVLIPTIVHLLQRDIGLSLLDEGFVWYGAQRVLAGEVPVRDFQAYDIGRYYWYAAWMGTTGSTGILPLRAGSVVLAALTTAMAVALVRRSGRQGAAALVLAAVTFALWLVPYYKVADSFAALLLLTGLAWLLVLPSARRGFGYGVCLGLAATIGMNHALYGVVGGALAVGWLTWKQPGALGIRGIGAMVLGGVAGYLPVLGFMLFVPGFGAAMVDNVQLLLETGTTNLERASPDLLDLSAPLRATTKETFQIASRVALMGVAFVAIPLFLLLCGWWLLRRRDAAQGPLHPAFIAAVLLSVPYAHYAYSRWDVDHLAVSALPLMLAVWTCPGQRPVVLRTTILALVTLASLLVAGPSHAFFQIVRGTPLQPVQVAGDTLRVRARTAAELRLVEEAARVHAPAPRSMYVVPYWPGAYAVTGRRSPTWEIYLIFPLSERRQQLEIDRLIAADVGLALVSASRMDSRLDLGFDGTHPLIARHLRRCMTSLTRPRGPVPGVDVMVGRLSTCPAEPAAPTELR